MKIRLRHLFVCYAAICFAIMVTVYIMQYTFGIEPCHICLMERMPWIVLFCTSLVLSLAPRTMHRYKYLMLALISLPLLASITLNIYHIGVQHFWWLPITQCTAPTIQHQSIDDLRNALLHAHPVYCESVQVKIFSLSLSSYSLIISMILLYVFIKVWMITQRTHATGNT